MIIENKGGRSAIEAGSVVDCTGDADICWLSGAPTEIFAQKNVLASWYYYYNKGAVKLTGLGAADIPEKYKTGKESRPLVDKRFTGLDGEELTEMVVLSHRELLKDILKHRQKEEDFIPVNIPGIPQIRMTRRMRGAYEMDDTEMHSHFEDSVGLFGDWRKNGPVYELPFRTLYCPEIKNLLSAGRCISVTDAMWDITRVIPVLSLIHIYRIILGFMARDIKTLSQQPCFSCCNSFFTSSLWRLKSIRNHSFPKIFHSYLTGFFTCCLAEISHPPFLHNLRNCVIWIN